MASEAPLVEIDRVTAGYGKKEVLREISFDLPPGSITTLVGANGAGKTTTVRALFGFLAISGGRVLLDSVPIQGLPASRRIQAGLGVVPEGGRAFSGLTVRENLELGGYLLRSPARVRDGLQWVWRLFPVLKDRDGQQAQTLSGGERQMLAIGRALMLRPRLLVLDEPSLGLSPMVLSSVFDALRELNQREGLTVLLIEQNVRAAFRIADRGHIMGLGRIARTIEHPDADELPPELTNAFLGSADREVER